jgi:glutamate racemase
MSNNTCPNLLIIDSGVGGLSVVREIIKTTPNINLNYIADNNLYPYGTMSERQLIERIIYLTDCFIKDFNIDFIVIACNSASTVVLPAMRERFHIPIIGVVPAIKPAAAYTRTKVVGLLATPGTVIRDYTDKLIQDFASDCTIIKVGSTKLVDLAEHYLEHNTYSTANLLDILSPFLHHPQAKDIDTMILGCTHFPLVRQPLQHVLPDHIRLIDSGHAVAKHIFRTLTKKNFKILHSNTMHPTYNSFFFTKKKALSPPLQNAIQEFGFDSIEFLNS